MLEEDPPSGEEEMFSTVTRCEGASKCHVCASVGTPQGGVEGGGSAAVGVVVGALGHEETIYLKIFQ